MAGLQRYLWNEEGEVTISSVELRNTLEAISYLRKQSCPWTRTSSTAREYLDNTQQHGSKHRSHDASLPSPF